MTLQVKGGQKRKLQREGKVKVDTKEVYPESNTTISRKREYFDFWTILDTDHHSRKWFDTMMDVTTSLRANIHPTVGEEGSAMWS